MNIPELPPTPLRTDLVTVYDYSSGTPVPAAPDDPMAMAALEVADAQARWYRDTLGYNGLDGQGAPFRIAVHAASGGFYRREQHLVVASDTSSATWRPLALDPEFYAHEFMHGIIEANAPAPAWPGGDWSVIHESWGMVLQNAADDDWLVNEDMLAPGARRKPGHVPYDIGSVTYSKVGDIPTNADFGADQQRKLTVAHAAVVAAEQLGRDAMSKIWFDTAIHKLDSTMDVRAAAAATVESAQELYGTVSAQAVQQAWESIGVLGHAQLTSSTRPAFHSQAD